MVNAVSPFLRRRKNKAMYAAMAASALREIDLKSRADLISFLDSVAAEKVDPGMTINLERRIREIVDARLQEINDLQLRKLEEGVARCRDLMTNKASSPQKYDEQAE